MKHEMCIPILWQFILLAYPFGEMMWILLIFNVNLIYAAFACVIHRCPYVDTVYGIYEVSLKNIHTLSQNRLYWKGIIINSVPWLAKSFIMMQGTFSETRECSQSLKKIGKVHCYFKYDVCIIGLCVVVFAGRHNIGVAPDCVWPGGECSHSRHSSPSPTFTAGRFLRVQNTYPMPQVSTHSFT